jgi:hypothetical protein
MVLNDNGEEHHFEVSNGVRTFTLKGVKHIKICGITFSTNKSLAHKGIIEEKIDKMESSIIA